MFDVEKYDFIVT